MASSATEAASGSSSNSSSTAPTTDEAQQRAAEAAAAKAALPRTALGLARGVFFVWIVGVSCIIGFWFVMVPPAAILCLFSVKAAKVFMNRLMGLWLWLPVAVIELVFGTKIVVTSNSGEKEIGIALEDALIIANHRTELDWLFFWPMAALTSSPALSSLLVVLKQELRMVPGVGWAMQAIQYPFVARNWEADKVTIASSIVNARTASDKLWLAIFPEGTALYHKSQKRCYDYMRSVNKPLYNYVLFPRIKGFVHCINTMGPNTALYDVTIAYPELRKGIAYRPTPIRMIWGHLPTEVHINITRYPPSAVPTGDDDKLEQMLVEAFDAKEARLKAYYEGPEGTTLGGRRLATPRSKWFKMVFFFAFWFLFHLVCLYLVTYVPWFRWYSLAGSIVAIVYSKVTTKKLTKRKF